MRAAFVNELLRVILTQRSVRERITSLRCLISLPQSFISRSSKLFCRRFVRCTRVELWCTLHNDLEI